MYDDRFDPDSGLDAINGGQDGGFAQGAEMQSTELRAIYYIHSILAQYLSGYDDENGMFPRATWQVTSVETQPFRELDKRYGEGAFWGIVTFNEMENAGCLVFLDYAALQALTGMSEEELNTDDGVQYIDGLLQTFIAIFGQVWQEIHPLDPSIFISPMAADLSELQDVLHGLGERTPMLTTALRVTNPTSGTGRIILAIPAGYLLLMQSGLQAAAEMTRTTTDQQYFYDRLAYVEDLPVAISVVLGKTEMTFAEIQSLEADDVIELEQTVGVPLEVRIGTGATLYGKPGTTIDGRRLAVQIVRT